MSVDSPEPRQRTVAELLAENGGQQSGRRRRRREEDEPGPAPVAVPEAEARPTPPSPPAAPHGGPGPLANGYGPPNGYGQAPNGRPHNGHANGYSANGYPANGYAPDGYARNGYAPEPVAAYENGVPAGYAPPAAPPPPSRPRGWAAPPPSSPPARAPEAAPGPWGPPTAGPGEPPTGAFATRPPAAGPGFAGPPQDPDGGPPTQLGGPPLDDYDDEDAYRQDPYGAPADGGYDEIDDRAWTGEHADEPQMTAPHRARAAAPDGGPPTQAGFGPDDLDDLDDRDDVDPDARDGGVTVAAPVADPAGRPGARRRRGAVADDELDPYDGVDEDLEPADSEPRAAGTGQAWAMVIAQWIGGAIVGAGVWVGFRYLWTYFEIVALALSVVATVGLVLGVRALLRNDDLRTTMFAVLVGLLLTVSPALLVLLDR